MMATEKREILAGAVRHAERVLAEREAAVQKAKAFLAECEAARDEAQQCEDQAKLNVELAKPFRVCFGAESKGLGLIMTAFLTSVDTTWLRATGKWFEKSFTRHCPVERDYVCFERREDDACEMMAHCPVEGFDAYRAREAQKLIKEISGANSHSPLKCFKVLTIDCANVFKCLGTLGEALSKNSELACLTFTTMIGRDARGELLEYFAENVRNCPYVAMLAIENVGTAFSGVGESLKNDRDFRMAAVEISGGIIVSCIHDHNPNNLDHGLVLAAMTSEGAALERLEEMGVEDRNRLVDRETMLAAVKQDGFLASACFRFDPNYSDDYEVMLAAVKENGQALSHASDRLKDDPRIVKAAVEQDGLMLGRVKAEFQRDEAIVLAAVTQNGMAIQYADKRFRESRTIAAAAVESNGLSLVYFAMALRLDNTIALTAVRQNAFAIQFTSAFENRGFFLGSSDQELAMAALSTHGTVFKFLPYCVRRDYDVCMTAVQQDGLALEFVVDFHKENEDIIEAAVKQNPLARKFINIRSRPYLEKFKQKLLESGENRQYRSNFLFTPLKT